MLDELNKIQYQLDSLNKQNNQIEDKLIQLNDNLSSYNVNLNDLLKEKQFYKNAIDIVYERSIKELKDILNSALSTIFYDRDFALDIVLSDKNGKSLQFKMTEEGKPVNLKRGTGMGVLTVISAVLQMYYLQCKNSRILMLDESYSAVSEEYVEAFFNFLSQMCQQLGFKIILITHDKRFLQYADKTYKLEKGEIVDEY